MIEKETSPRLTSKWLIEVFKHKLPHNCCKEENKQVRGKCTKLGPSCSPNWCRHQQAVAGFPFQLKFNSSVHFDLQGVNKPKGYFSKSNHLVCSLLHLPPLLFEKENKNNIHKRQCPWHCVARRVASVRVCVCVCVCVCICIPDSSKTCAKNFVSPIFSFHDTVRGGGGHTSLFADSGKKFSESKPPTFNFHDVVRRGHTGFFLADGEIFSESKTPTVSMM